MFWNNPPKKHTDKPGDRKFSQEQRVTINPDGTKHIEYVQVNERGETHEEYIERITQEVAQDLENGAE